MKNLRSTHTNKILKLKYHNMLMALTSVTMCLFISGCGQRGALFIPTVPEAAQRSTIGDILTKPASAPATETSKPSSTTSPATSPAPAK